jgi:hypothetical protein
MMRCAGCANLIDLPSPSVSLIGAGAAVGAAVGAIGAGVAAGAQALSMIVINNRVDSSFRDIGFFSLKDEASRAARNGVEGCVDG